MIHFSKYGNFYQKKPPKSQPPHYVPEHNPAIINDQDVYVGISFIEFAKFDSVV